MFKKWLNEKLREELADHEHRQWQTWANYQLDNMTDENIQKWKRQCKTKYEDLSEKEKNSDREWADKVLKITKKYVKIKNEEKTREELANLEHEQFIHWCTYVFKHQTDADFKEWRRQANTKYEDLNKEEKDGDREWANKDLCIIFKYME